MNKSPITERIKNELEVFQFNEEQILGFMFHLGFTIDQYAKYIDVYSWRGTRLMENNPYSYLIDEEFEIEDNLLSYDSDNIRSCYFTFAKVIHEEWVKKIEPLDNFINVGQNYLFTEEMQEDIWNSCSEMEFTGSNVDLGYLIFLENVGIDLKSKGITDCYECLWYGNDLYLGSILDDNASYSYVVDKINTLMPPFLKMMLYYPINIEINKESYNNLNLFSNVFLSAVELEGNDLVKELSCKWMRDRMFNSDGNMLEKYSLIEENLNRTIMQLAFDGFQFKYSLNSIQLDEIINAGNVYQIADLEGTNIDLNTYVTIIVQIIHRQYGLDCRARNWSNYGSYLQFLSFYFILAIRYSVYFNDLIEEQND